MPEPKRVWVTGGTGFFGGHIARRLGDRAIVTSRHEVDLLDLDQVERFLRQNPVDAIVHAAALVGGIQFHSAHPGRVASDNLRMGLNVLDAAARHRKPHVVLISSACVYADTVPIPMKEADIPSGTPGEPTGPYGIAKRTLHTVAHGLEREFGLSSTILIPINLYGPGDHFEEARSHVVPALLKRAIEARDRGAQELVVWGDGSQTRDFLYVEDAAEGVERALNPVHAGQEFNLGSGRETSIRELAETIRRAVGFGGELVFDASKPGGSPRRALDPMKAAKSLGFQARTELEEGLRKTLAWWESR